MQLVKSITYTNYLLQLNTMSEKVSAGRETNNVVAKIVPQLTPLNTDTSSRHLLPQVDSIPDTPIGFSDTPKSLYKRDTCLKKGRPEEDLHPAKTESQQRETKAVKLEWVEQYEPGVYITLVVLPSGQKGLKRVRFRYFLSESFHVCLAILVHECFLL